MKTAEIRMNVARTINLGNYNSLRLEAGLTVTIEPSDDYDQVKEAMQIEIEDMLKQQYSIKEMQFGDRD